MIRILIVDDEVEICDNVAEVVRDGFPDAQIDHVYSGKEAKRLLQAGDYDVLLTDIGMPLIGGFELLAYTLEHALDVSVIFLTGYHEFDYVYRASQHRNVRYLVKTEREEKIVDAVQEAVRERKLVQANQGVLNMAKERLAQAEAMLSKEAVRRHIDESDGELALMTDVDRLTEIVLDIKAYIRENLERDITLTNIAQSFHFNATYLSRIFRAGTGDKLGDYISRKKMEAAKQYLCLGDTPINEISSRLGYESGQSFARAFKQHLGMTPMEYRRKFSKHG